MADVTGLGPSAPTIEEQARMSAAIADAYYATADEFEEFDEGSPDDRSEMGSFGGLVNADGPTMTTFTDRAAANLKDALGEPGD